MRSLWWLAVIALVFLCVATFFSQAAGDSIDEEEEEDEEEDSEAEDTVLSRDQLTALHAKFDADGDGKASLPELMAFARRASRELATRDAQLLMEDVDINQDGRLSLEEHLADFRHQGSFVDEEEEKDLEHRQKLEAAKHAAADLDGDKVLDINELPSLFFPETSVQAMAVFVAEAIRLKDKNGDGKLSPEEFWEVMADDQDSVLSKEEREDFSKLDSDGDGWLDSSELQDWESGWFHKAEALQQIVDITDANGDLHVTMEELVDKAEQLEPIMARYYYKEWVRQEERSEL